MNTNTQEQMFSCCRDFRINASNPAKSGNSGSYTNRACGKEKTNTSPAGFTARNERFCKCERSWRDPKAPRRRSPRKDEKTRRETAPHYERRHNICLC